MVLIVTCEHSHNKIPAKYKTQFPQHNADSPEGWDIGALELATRISRKCHASLFYGRISKLIVDLHRSPKEGIDRSILERYYYPYREDVIDLIDLLVLEKVQVFHLSVHTFAPTFNGKPRDCAIGLQFDPNRTVEKSFCLEFRHILEEMDPSLKVRFNYPYKGVRDNFTQTLRKRYRQGRYVGIELEVNQKYCAEKRQWEKIKKEIAHSLELLFQ